MPPSSDRHAPPPARRTPRATDRLGAEIRVERAQRRLVPVVEPRLEPVATRTSVAMTRRCSSAARVPLRGLGAECAPQPVGKLRPRMRGRRVFAGRAVLPQRPTERPLGMLGGTGSILACWAKAAAAVSTAAVGLPGYNLLT
jgi:hypothetical protein